MCRRISQYARDTLKKIVCSTFAPTTNADNGSHLLSTESMLLLAETGK